MSALHRVNLVGRHRGRRCTAIATAAPVASGAAVADVGIGGCRGAATATAARSPTTNLERQLERTVAPVQNVLVTPLVLMRLRLLLLLLMVLAGEQFTKHWHRLRPNQGPGTAYR